MTKEEDRQHWQEQLAKGEITQEEFDDLVKGQEDVEEMEGK